MKAHIGMETDSDLVRSVVGTVANAITQTHALVYGKEETDVFAGAGYQGLDKRQKTQDLKANWDVAMREGKRRALNKSTRLASLTGPMDKAKASSVPR